MFEKTVEDVLNGLIQIDIDATFAYQQAIGDIQEPAIQLELKSFLADHRRHIQELSALLREIGGKPINLTRDIKGYIIEGMTSLRGLAGTQATLRAMITNENLINSYYKEALEYAGFPKDVRSLIKRNFDDEKRHLDVITTLAMEERG